MAQMKDIIQQTKLLNRFFTGWRGAAFRCADIGIGDSSFKRLVHEFRRKNGNHYILSEYVANKEFTGQHKEYWMNPECIRAASHGFEQTNLFN
jgi:hypothetical protein